MAKLRSDLSSIAARLPKAATAALLQTAADIVDLTKQLAPVDTGALRHSYGALPISSNEVHVGTDREYGKYVEFGTSKMGAQPHLTPAFMQAEDTFRRRIEEELQKLN